MQDKEDPDGEDEEDAAEAVLIATESTHSMSLSCLTRFGIADVAGAIDAIADEAKVMSSPAVPASERWRC